MTILFCCEVVSSFFAYIPQWFKHKLLALCYFNVTLSICFHWCFALFYIQHHDRQYVLGRLFFVVATFLCFTLGFHSKVNEKDKKEKLIECNFKNVLKIVTFLGEWIYHSFSQKRSRYFNASKSNISNFSCNDYDIRLFENLNLKQLNNVSRFTNSPIDCQAYCNGERYCRLFTFKFDTNQCWFVLID